MYISPTLPAGGGLCATHACTQFPALASKHIGSGPGVSGASGMQVHPLVPLRTVVMAPFASTVMTDALCAIAAGAADSALATGSLLFAAELVFVSAARVLFSGGTALLLQASTAITDPASSRISSVLIVMNPSVTGEEG